MLSSYVKSKVIDPLKKKLDDFKDADNDEKDEILRMMFATGLVLNVKILIHIQLYFQMIKH